MKCGWEALDDIAHPVIQSNEFMLDIPRLRPSLTTDEIPVLYFTQRHEWPDAIAECEKLVPSFQRTTDAKTPARKTSSTPLLGAPDRRVSRDRRTG